MNVNMESCKFLFKKKTTSWAATFSVKTTQIMLVQTQDAWNFINETPRNTYQIHHNNCAHFFIFHILQKKCWNGMSDLRFTAACALLTDVFLASFYTYFTHILCGQIQIQIYIYIYIILDHVVLMLMRWTLKCSVLSWCWAGNLSTCCYSHIPRTEP